MSVTVDIRARVSPAFTLNVSFTTAAGITILFGASGSGKTTVLRGVAGLTRPDAGRITIGDRVVFDDAAGIDVPVQQRRAGYVFQQLALFPHMTLAQNIGYGWRNGDPTYKWDRVRAIAGAFAIDHLLDRPPDRVSGGERQRAALARALVSAPDVLLLDEPLSALDHRIRMRIIDDLRRWNETHGIPMLYVTHSHQEAFALGEQIIVVDAGTVVSSGVPLEVLERPSRGTVASLAGFENIFAATVRQRDERGGTMTCQLGSSAAVLEVPLDDADAGSVLHVAIRAGDILVATEEPRGVSANNVLRATLTALHIEGATVVARFDAGQAFIVHLTSGSLARMGLAVGDAAWLIIKTYSCRVLAH